MSIPFHHHLQQPAGDDAQSVLLSQSQQHQSHPHRTSFMPEMSTEQIDRFIRFQSQRFRLLLDYKLNQIETRTRLLFQQKNEEIAYANNRRFDLEQLLIRLQTENQERQRVAQENQAMIASLTHALGQIREIEISTNANDAESSNNNHEDAIDYGNKKRMMNCRICNSRISCMLLLPCRHLCSCKPCENALDFCPVCNTTKKASIEAVIF